MTKKKKKKSGGWYNDPNEHALASKGVETKFKSRGRKPKEYSEEDVEDILGYMYPREDRMYWLERTKTGGTYITRYGDEINITDFTIYDFVNNRDLVTSFLRDIDELRENFEKVVDEELLDDYIQRNISAEEFLDMSDLENEYITYERTFVLDSDELSKIARDGDLLDKLLPEHYPDDEEPAKIIETALFQYPRTHSTGDDFEFDETYDGVPEEYREWGSR